MDIFICRNFRKFYLAQGIALTVSWMQMLTISWLVCDVTKSVVTVSLVPFLLQMPTVVLAFISGKLADSRYCMQFFLMINCLGFIQGILLAWFSFVQFDVFYILLMTGFRGVISAFELPLRQAIACRMVDQKLSEKVALFGSIQVGIARLLGPALAGILIQQYGLAVSLIVSLAAYIPMLLMVYDLQSKKVFEVMTTAKMGLINGVHRFILFRWMLSKWILFMGLVAFISMSFVTLLPVLVADRYGGSAAVLGLLMGSSAFGGVCASGLLTFSAKIFEFCNKNLGWLSLIAGAMLCSLAFKWRLYELVMVLIVLGALLIMLATVAHLNLQRNLSDAFRGRGMALFSAAVALVPLGGLCLGVIAEFISYDFAFVVSGMLCASIVFPFAVYIQR